MEYTVLAGTYTDTIHFGTVELDILKVTTRMLIPTGSPVSMVWLQHKISRFLAYSAVT